jgi:hypothetical protein
VKIQSDEVIQFNGKFLMFQIIQFIKLFISDILDRAVIDTIRNLSLKNEPIRKSSSEYIDTITKKQLQYKKHKQVGPDNHHSGTNIARTLLSIFGMLLYLYS